MAKVKGYTVKPNGKLLAHVKVHGVGQRSKQFDAGTSAEEIELWRATERLAMKKAKPAVGTLAGDILAFLEMIPDAEQSRKEFFTTWLTKWKESPLGAKPRKAMTLEECQKLFNTKWNRYAGSSKNHLRSTMISLWKHFDGIRHQCPVLEIEKFPEASARKGFFTPEQVDKISEVLSPDYADAVEFFAVTGWRSEEVKKLRWDEVDSQHRLIRLSPDRAKNGEGREISLDQVEDIINRRVALRELRQSEYVFTYQYGGKGKRKTRIQYRPVGDWRKSWKKACIAAGCPGALVHGFRRTVVMHLDKAGVSRSVAMKMVGHRTESMYHRYRIVPTEELHSAAAALKKHLGKEPEPEVTS
jgi:integrase